MSRDGQRFSAGDEWTWPGSTSAPVPIGSGLHERWTPIYDSLAPFYDPVVGDALFPAIRDSFEWCRRRLGLRFRAVADIGCGTGRLLRHLLRYPARLIGVDASAATLRLAAQRLQGRNVLLLCQDIRQLQLPHPVDLITCNGDTLNYLLQRDDLAASLRHCRNHLTPGGYMIGDFLAGVPAMAADSAQHRCIRLPGLISWWNWQALPARRMTQVTIRFAFTEGNHWRWAREVHWQRWYRWSELRESLLQAGLSECRVWTMPADGGAGPTGSWCKFAARRPGCQWRDDRTASAKAKRG